MPQPPNAIVLCASALTADDQRLVQLLDLFGVRWKAVAIDEVERELLPTGFCLFSSASAVAAAVANAHESTGELPRWMTSANSAYIHSFDDTPTCQRILRFLTGDPGASSRRLMNAQAVMTVTDAFPELCGPMSGLKVPVRPRDEDRVFAIDGAGHRVEKLISADEGDLFVEVTRSGVPLYL